MAKASVSVSPETHVKMEGENQLCKGRSCTWKLWQAHAHNSIYTVIDALETRNKLGPTSTQPVASSLYPGAHVTCVSLDNSMWQSCVILSCFLFSFVIFQDRVSLCSTGCVSPFVCDDLTPQLIVPSQICYNIVYLALWYRQPSHVSLWSTDSSLPLPERAQPLLWLEFNILRKTAQDAWDGHQESGKLRCIRDGLVVRPTYHSCRV